MKLLNNIFSLCLSFLSDKLYCQVTFLLKQKRLPNLKDPVLINDKFLYLKLNDRNLLYKSLVDKYTVREYVVDKIGEQYLIPIIGVYNNVQEIDINKLPNKFVLKITNGSQNNLICKDKTKLNWTYSKKQINKWAQQNFYKRTREWPYKGVANRIVVEKYLENNNGTLEDYKFWCFNGEAKFVGIDSDRFSNHKRDYYDVQMKKKLPFEISYKNSKKHKRKPENYDKMLEIVAVLSKSLNFVRVDLYNINGSIYFGELTFYPDNCNGRVEPFEYEKLIGDYLDISKI